MADRSTETSSTGAGAGDKAKETMRDLNKGTADTRQDASDDVSKLRADLTRLTEQVTEILGGKGGSAYQSAYESARAGVEGVVSGASARAGEAREAVGEVTETFADAIDESLERRPYTTLAMAVGVGFLLGAMWRR